jgi:hypothetical protein
VEQSRPEEPAPRDLSALGDMGAPSNVIVLPRNDDDVVSDSEA